jgi:hypothetical protein
MPFVHQFSPPNTARSTITDHRSAAAFTMAIVLGTYINSSIKHARSNAVHEREKKLDDVMVQRRKLGMDGEGGWRGKGEGKGS